MRWSVPQRIQRCGFDSYTPLYPKPSVEPRSASLDTPPVHEVAGAEPHTGRGDLASDNSLMLRGDPAAQKSLTTLLTCCSETVVVISASA